MTTSWNLLDYIPASDLRRLRERWADEVLARRAEAANPAAYGSEEDIRRDAQAGLYDRPFEPEVLALAPPAFRELSAKAHELYRARAGRLSAAERKLAAYFAETLRPANLIPDEADRAELLGRNRKLAAALEAAREAASR